MSGQTPAQVKRDLKAVRTACRAITRRIRKVDQNPRIPFKLYKRFCDAFSRIHYSDFHKDVLRAGPKRDERMWKQAFALWDHGFSQTSTIDQAIADIRAGVKGYTPERPIEVSPYCLPELRRALRPYRGA